MDSGDGNLRILTEAETTDIYDNYPEQKINLFTIGEEVRIKSSRFRIVKITTKKITLRILPKE